MTASALLLVFAILAGSGHFVEGADDGGMSLSSRISCSLAAVLTDGAPEVNQGVDVPTHLLPVACVVVVAAIIFIYGRKGIWVVASILTYLTSLSTMKLAVKWVFQSPDFRFPQILTGMHAAASGLLCVPILLRRRAETGEPIAVPTAREMLFMITPIAVAGAASISANNEALRYCSVSFVIIVASTACICTMGMVVLLGMPFEPALLIPAFVLVFGCALSTVGELNFSLIGMLFALAANMLRATRGALQQKLMTGEDKNKFDPCTLLLWSSVPSVVLSLVCSLLFEGTQPYRALFVVDGSVILAILLSCVNAAVLNLSNLIVTKHLGAVGAQMVSQVRAVVTVVADIVIFHEPMTAIEFVGFGVVLAGVYGYAEMENWLKQKREMEKAALMEKA